MSEKGLHSVTWQHNGETWTATVGEQLHGYRIETRGRGRKKTYARVELFDPARILQVGAYEVWHDLGHAAQSRSEWNNPITIGSPIHIVKSE